MDTKAVNQIKSTSDFLTIEQTSEFLNLKTSQLRSMVFKKQIPALKLGGCLRFSKEDLNEWLNEKRKQKQ